MTSVDHDAIQRIGGPGEISLCDLQLGRGANINTNRAIIQGGLHVIIAASVPSDRLLRQMIGRTGRMGQDGSYSIIFNGSQLIVPPSAPKGNIRKILHGFSSLGVRNLIQLETSKSVKRREWAQKYIMTLTNADAMWKQNCSVYFHKPAFDDLFPASFTQGKAFYDMYSSVFSNSELVYDTTGKGVSVGAKEIGDP